MKMNYRFVWVNFLTQFVPICLLIPSCVRGEPGELEEFCHLDVFNASCPHGNVIMMESALYGRMRVGRCLTTSYFIGCYADVLPWMDSECSGKRVCSVKTVDSDLLKFHPCRKDLMPYLEAKYDCISTQQWSPEECMNSKHVTVEQPSGYISVKLGHKAHSGTRDCPWKVKAKAGQKVELKLYRFTYNSEKKNTVMEQGEQCQHSLVFVDGKNQREVTLCSGYAREEHVYTSVGSEVEVYIRTDSSTIHHHKSTVLLRYKAIGCADIAKLPEAEISRTAGTAVVKCKNSQETWHLVCKDNTWIGDIRNCSRTVITEGPNKSERNVSTDFRNKVQYGILIAVSVGLILGVFLGFTLLMCMAFYRRKKRRRKGTEMETTRQNTLLCDYSDDKSQYASFLPANQYSSFMSREQSRAGSRDELASESSVPLAAGDHVTCSCESSRVVPCDMVQDTQILESGTPDVIYSPRIPPNGNLMTCEACRTNEILHSIYSKGPVRPNTSTNRNTSFMPLNQSGRPIQTGGSNQPIAVSYSTYDTLPAILPGPNPRLPVVTEADPLNGNTSDYDSINSTNENREHEVEQIVSV